MRITSGKKKAHKHKHFGPVALGTTPGSSQGQIRAFSIFYTIEAQFVPGTNLVCPWDNPGDEGRHKEFMCLKFMCLLLAKNVLGT